MKIERDKNFTFTGLSEKESKNLIVFDLIKSKSVISRTDISKDTGINMVSVSNYIKSFIDKGLLYDKGPDVSTGGRKPELLELATGDGGALGISINGDRVDMVLTDLSALPVEKRSSAFGDALKLARELCAAANSRGIKVKAVGIGSETRDSIALLKSVSDAAKAPAFAGRNVYCAAFGERSLGNKASCGGILYVHSSLGECVLIKESELLGSSDEPKETTKYLRPWGRALSAETMARGEVAKGVGTKIVHIAGADMNKITEGSVIEALKEGDEVAGGIIESVGINLGLRIAYLVNIFAPKTVIIGGGIEAAGEAILSGVKRTVARLAHSSRSKSISIIPSALGPDGVALGASALAIRELFLRS
ncbi:MAG: ROK family protein [Candidatus Omnitrophica bacterium]|nr:ROK family protein [Candidatus Omnitrophota bacterium]